MGRYYRGEILEPDAFQDVGVPYLAFDPGNEALRIVTLDLEEAIPTAAVTDIEIWWLLDRDLNAHSLTSMLQDGYLDDYLTRIKEGHSVYGKWGALTIGAKRAVTTVRDWLDYNVPRLLTKGAEAPRA